MPNCLRRASLAAGWYGQDMSAWVSAMTIAPRCAEVTVPVLVIHGADDLQSEAATRLYVDAFPNVEFAVIENAGHFTFEEQPEQFATIVKSFLAGIAD